MFKIKTERIEEEIIIKEEVKYFNKLSLTLGTLFLTSNRLYFKSTETDDKNISLSLMLEGIQNVKILILPGKLTNGFVITINNKKWLFFTNESKTWVNTIKEHLGYK